MHRSKLGPEFLVRIERKQKCWEVKISPGSWGEGRATVARLWGQVSARGRLCSQGGFCMVLRGFGFFGLFSHEQFSGGDN